MLRAALKFARLRVTIMLWAIAFIGSASNGDATIRTLLSLVVLAVWYIHATTVNDYADYEIDKINLSQATDRPLLSDKLSFGQLWFLHFLSGVAALGLSYLYGRSALLLTVFMLVINYAYSLKPVRLSDRGIIAQLVLAFSYVYYPLALGYWSNDGARFPWLLSSSIFLAFMARMLLKDFRDLKGDKKHKKLTFLLRHGVKKTVLLSFLCWLFAAVAIGIVIKRPGIYLVLAAAFSQVLILLRVLAYPGNHSEQQAAITFIAKAANALIIMLLAFLLSSHERTLTNVQIELIPTVLGLVLLAFNWIRYDDYRRMLITPRSASTSTS